LNSEKRISGIDEDESESRMIGVMTLRMVGVDVGAKKVMKLVIGEGGCGPERWRSLAAPSREPTGLLLLRSWIPSSLHLGA
jgi:hypothetical protein